MELEEEELVAPVRPQRITRNMRSGELLKLQRETSKAILSHLIYDMEEKESEATVRYEGDSAAYRLWERAVISATEGIDYDNLERIIKYDEIDEYGDEDWNLWYTPKDRRFLYRVLMDTLSPAAKDIVERQDKNGILVFRFFFKRWGTPSISNSISALQELMSIKLPTHDNPAPIFRQIERIVRVFFPDCGENIKIAILLNVLPERKYKSVVDTLETSQNRVGYSELKDMIIRYWMRQQSTYEGKAKGNASAYGADTGRVSRNRPRWCPTCNDHVTDHNPSDHKYHKQMKKQHKNHYTYVYDIFLNSAVGAAVLSFWPWQSELPCLSFE